MLAAGYGLNFPAPVKPHNNLRSELCPFCARSTSSLSRHRSIALRWRSELCHSLAKIAFAHDRVAIEDLPGLVSAQLHRHRLRDPGDPVSGSQQLRGVRTSQRALAPAAAASSPGCRAGPDSLMNASRSALTLS